MKPQIRTLAESVVRDHLSDPYDVVETVDVGEFLEEAGLDVDTDMDDFYEAIEGELSWLIDRLVQRAADRGEEE